MSDYTLTEDDRKRLMELLGECWHEDSGNFAAGNYQCMCGFESPYRENFKEHCENKHRTFTTPDDMIALAEALQKKGEWKDFAISAFMKWEETTFDRKYRRTELDIVYFTYWLMVENPARFCWLVAELTKGEKE